MLIPCLICTLNKIRRVSCKIYPIFFRLAKAPEIFKGMATIFFLNHKVNKKKYGCNFLKNLMRFCFLFRVQNKRRNDFNKDVRVHMHPRIFRPSPSHFSALFIDLQGDIFSIMDSSSIEQSSYSPMIWLTACP